MAVILSGGDLARIYAAGISAGHSTAAAGEVVDAFIAKLTAINRGRAPHIGDPVVWEGAEPPGDRIRPPAPGVYGPGQGRQG
jgi:hypothetical protein